MSATWIEQLQQQLIDHFGKKKGIELSERYHSAFSAGYIDDYSPANAIRDIEQIELLATERQLIAHLYIVPEKAEFPLHLRLYQFEKPIPLSDILPTLENFGLRTINDRSNRITPQNSEKIWISDFSLSYPNPDFNIELVKKLFEDAFTSTYHGYAENDGFNKLVLGAALSWREILILRAYAKYLRQVGFRFSQSYIEKALASHPVLAKLLVNYFIQLHDPSKQSKAKQNLAAIEQEMTSLLEQVTSLDEDRIIHRLFDVIKATLRTNYFQPNAHGEHKNYLAFKLNSRSIPELPLPVPLYEIFVYAPDFEGIHLRNAKVARGGIRWSDRREDFRTEILGLMKAQVVKNSVIVPSGAKGGFVLKALPPAATREIIQKEVVKCYKNFISGLLDLTDNIVNNEFIRPNHVVTHDDIDPYLVVAADKGTATFSDIANSIANDYHFWLGDAFASGGSTGYDHKKMGITARGAWESVKRHFRESNIDVTNTDITVVGIGDMSGDVFGNGMLYTNHIRLIAAFDHRHIFIDPNPNGEKSYYERARLFTVPNSSWEDYNPELISQGGGVFKRSLKSIAITPQIKAALDISSDSLTPNELIRAILKAPVDLLFNGGIGTYVKASTESHIDVGDRTNDYCRVNGGELRCKIVGEGGNLGFTQLGRIEYALTGGLINTDFIDNSAGVDCSDHEVNLKILLNQEVQKHKLTYEKRNDLLASLTEDIAGLVLKDNYSQALVMSFTAFHAKKNIGLHSAYIKELENVGLLNRAVEFIPDDKKLMERKAANIGLTRPEIAILLAYTKIHIKQEILQSDIINDPYLSQIIFTAFPNSVGQHYRSIINSHPLHHDIIATQLSNLVVNEMGITFVYRLQVETGASIPEIIRAYAVAAQVFGSHELFQLIESLDYKISMNEQYEMLYNIRNLINLSTRWFLRSNHINGSLQKVVDHFSSRVKELEPIIPTLMAGATKTYLENLTDRFSQAGLTENLARRIATYRAIYTALNIIDVATHHKFDLEKTAKIYFSAGERVNLLWFRDQIASDSREGHWNVIARLSLRDELDISQRALTIAIINTDKKENDALNLINKWIANNQRALERWEKMLSMLVASTNIDYSMFFITIRELYALITTAK